MVRTKYLLQSHRCVFTLRARFPEMLPSEEAELAELSEEES